MSRLHLFRRAILTALAILFGWLAINPIIRSKIVSSVQSVSGAATTIDSVQTNWRNRQVTLQGLTIVDPHRENHNLMIAESVELELDQAALWQRQAVVKRGHIRGLRLGTTRNSVAAALSPEKVAAYQANVTERFQRVSGGWMENASDRVAKGWTNDVAAAQLAQRFAAAWPQQHQTIESNATELLSRAVAIRKQLEDSGDNRLRNRETYRLAASEIERLANEINEVERHSTQLQQQMRMDRDALTAACQQDTLSLEQQAEMAELDGTALSDYLVGAEVSESLATVLHWVAWSRRLTPMIANSTKVETRGRDLLFGRTAKADVLIESLVLQGKMDLGGGEVPLDGTIRNWSSNASTTGKPTEIVIQTSGQTPMLIQSILDRGADVPKDQIVIDCPRMPRQRRILGGVDLNLTVSSGDVHTWCHIDLHGDQLSGKLLLRQANAEFTSPNTRQSSGSPAASQALAAAVKNLKTLDISVELGGTLATPEWSLSSNVGPHVAKNLHRSFQEQLVNGSKQQVLMAQQNALTELHKIETQLVERQTTTMTSLRESLAAIHQVRDRIASRVRLTDAMIDPSSPLREVYTR